MKNYISNLVIFYFSIVIILVHQTPLTHNAYSNLRYIELKGHEDAVYSPSFRRDGTVIVTGSKDGTAKVWDTKTGRELLSLVGHGGTVYSAQFSPNQLQILTASKDGTTRIWDGLWGKEIALLHGISKSELEFYTKQNLDRIVSVNDGVVRVLDPSKGFVTDYLQVPSQYFVSATIVNEEVYHRGIGLGAHSRAAYRDYRKQIIACDQNGQITLSKFSDKPGYITITEPAQLERVTKITTFQSSDVNSKTIQIKDGVLKVNDNFNDFFFKDSSKISSATLSLNGTLLFACDKTGVLYGLIYNEENENRLIQQYFRFEPQSKYSVYSASFSPDGKTVVHNTRPGFFKIVRSSSGMQEKEIEGSKDAQFYSTQFSPDGRRIVTASSDHNAQIWNSETGKLLMQFKGHSGPVYSAQFSPDGSKVVTAAQDKTARIWDTNTGKEILCLGGRTNFGHTHEVTSASYSLDGKKIITGSYDHSAILWDARTGEALSVLRGHTSGISGAVFSPDGKQVVTTSYDNTARIWFLRPEFDFELDSLPKTLKLLQKRAYHQGGQKNFFIELQNIAEKEALTWEQKQILFLTLKSYLNNPKILSQQMDEEVLPSLEKSAKALARTEGVSDFADIGANAPVIQTVISLLRASVLAMKEAGGARPDEQVKLNEVLRALALAQTSLLSINPSQIRPMLSVIGDLVKNLAQANPFIIENWACSNDLRSSYARVYEELFKYLEGI